MIGTVQYIILYIIIIILNIQQLNIHHMKLEQSIKLQLLKTKNKLKCKYNINDTTI
jgi:hypothetical protein